MLGLAGKAAEAGTNGTRPNGARSLSELGCAPGWFAGDRARTSSTANLHAKQPLKKVTTRRISYYQRQRILQSPMCVLSCNSLHSSPPLSLDGDLRSEDDDEFVTALPRPKGIRVGGGPTREQADDQAIGPFVERKAKQVTARNP